MADSATASAVVSLQRRGAGGRTTWVATRALPANLACFQGHFPGQPILAGIVQLHWATQLYARCWADPRAVVRVTRLKFTRVIRAWSPLELRLDSQSGGDDFAFSYWVGATCCATGRVHLAGPPPVRDRAGV